MRLRVASGSPLRGRVTVPGDKSISHRAVLLNALADGPSQVVHFLRGGDTLATLDTLRTLDVEVSWHADASLTVHGRGLHGLRAPDGTINCRNSGTTMRLLAGILAGQSFSSVLDGSQQLRRRPMRRITTPLRQMGAAIADSDGHAPLLITGRPLRGIDYPLPMPSAQVKSAVLLAGLFAQGPTTVREPGPARDHTERMLRAMGADLSTDSGVITLEPGARRLEPLDVTVPGDLSSAAFLIVAACLVPGSEVVVEGVGVNPTRTGLLDVLRAMGARVELADERQVGAEPVADLRIASTGLRAVEVGGPTVVRMIDEFPVLAVAATQAQGMTMVRDAAELRVKETDRIARLVGELQRMGARIEERSDGFVVEGPAQLSGAVVESHGDHRLAMALAVAGLIAQGETVITSAGCIADSFPDFPRLLAHLGGDVR